MSTHSEDEALLRACRQGDEAAWERILEKYERLVFSIARNNGLGREDAADITQLTFTHLIEALDRMTDEGNLRAWLATVAKRNSRRFLVRQLRYRSSVIEPELIDVLLPDKTGSNPIEQWELADWLRSALDRIDARCRHLLTLLYFNNEDLSYAEIAAKTGMAEGSVGPIRARCLERLRETLAAD